MVAEIRITGAEQLRALGRDLKAAGVQGQGLRRELLRGMRAAEKPLKDAVHQSALDSLPKKGGLNEWVAAESVTARNSLSGRGAGVRIVARKKGGKKGSHDLEAVDAGNVRHPVWGRWLKDVPTQSVESGYFTKPLNEAAPELIAVLSMAIEITARRIAKGTF